MKNLPARKQKRIHVIVDARSDAERVADARRVLVINDADPSKNGVYFRRRGKLIRNEAP